MIGGGRALPASAAVYQRQSIVKGKQMTKAELENLNAELIAVLRSVRDQIDEALDSLADDDDTDDLGEFDDDEAEDD